MKIQQTPREDHQMEVVVELEADQLEAARRRAARKISEKARIPGFRPGKAPYPVILRYYGEAAITEEAIEILVDENYPKMLEEAQIRPGAAGALENVEKLDPPTFKFLVPLAPTVDLGAYRTIRLPYAWEGPDDEKVDEAIQQLREMYSTTEAVEREIRPGDFVMLDVHGTIRKPAEGDEEIDLNRDGYPVFVREEKKADEWPFPGFSTKLVGLTPGQEAAFSHKFSKETEEERLRGKSVGFQVTVKNVRGVNLPELNDEFAKTVGGGETLADLRERLRENLERQSKAEYDDKYYLELFDLIKQGATISYPPQVLEHETEHVMEELTRRLGEQHMDLETYFKVRNTDQERFMAEEARPTAQRRLERSLMIDEIAREQKIELSEAEVTNAFQEDWAALSATDEKFQKLTKGGKRANRDLVNAVVMDAANRTMVARVLDYLKSVATGQVAAEQEPGSEDEAPKPKKRARKRKEPVESAPAVEANLSEGEEANQDDPVVPGSLT